MIESWVEQLFTDAQNKNPVLSAWTLDPVIQSAISYHALDADSERMNKLAEHEMLFVKKQHFDNRTAAWHFGSS